MSQTHQATGVRRLGLLSLGALGVVYGDIGTSPIYALRESLAHGIEPTHDNVLGILSLIFWALTLLISVEYQMVVLRADNRGEGGILALLALLRPSRHRGSAWLGPLLQKMAVLGAALMLCDGVLTPAISVLSAVEGLEVAAPQLAPLVLPGRSRRCGSWSWRCSAWLRSCATRACWRLSTRPMARRSCTTRAGPRCVFWARCSWW
jgi:KUP system potassium uptake protein